MASWPSDVLSAMCLSLGSTGTEPLTVHRWMAAATQEALEHQRLAYLTHMQPRSGWVRLPFYFYLGPWFQQSLWALTDSKGLLLPNTPTGAYKPLGFNPDFQRFKSSSLPGKAASVTVCLLLSDTW